MQANPGAEGRQLTRSWRFLDTIPLRYQGMTPLATCHWQWIANVLAADGYGDYWSRLGQAWGCGWRGDGVLFGSMDWPAVVRQTLGADVAIRTHPRAADARAAELDLSEQGLPFVAEVDEFFLPEGTASGDHIVHAVLVLERTAQRARFVDSRVSGDVIEYPAADYETLRSSNCWGRAEPYKLYVIMQSPMLDPAPQEFLDSIRGHLRRNHGKSQEALRDYIGWACGSGERIDVCRVAGERYQAALLFEYLAGAGIPGASEITGRFRELADDWYLVHMLAAHERGLEKRGRQRQIRILENLAFREASTTEAILS